MNKGLLVLPGGRELYSGTPGKDAVCSITHTSAVNGTGELNFGEARADELEITLWVEPDSDLWITAGDALTYYRVDDGGTRTLIGKFWAEKPKRASAHSYTVLAYDSMVLADKDLSPWLRGAQGQFPLTLLAFAKLVAAQCGLIIATTTLPRNGAYQVKAFYADGLTGRKLLGWVAQAAGCYLHCNATGALVFAEYVDLRGKISIGQDDTGPILAAGGDGALLQDSTEAYLALKDDFGAMVPYTAGGLSYEDYTTAPIDKVQIKQTDADVGVIYPADEQGTNTYVIAGNLLLCTDTDPALRPVAAALYAALQRLPSYTPCEMTVWDGLTPPPGSFCLLRTGSGLVVTACVMRAVTGSGQTVKLTGTGSATRDSVTATNTSTYKNLQGRVLELSTTVDGLEVKAGDLQGNYTSLKLSLDGLATKVVDLSGNYTSLVQSVDGLSADVVHNGEVRSKFAMDGSSASIESGKIIFKGNTLEVDSQNFKLAEDGTVNITGTFMSRTASDIIYLSNGSLFAWRTVGGKSQQTVKLGTRSDAANGFGDLILYGLRENGTPFSQVHVSADNAGPTFHMWNAAGELTTNIDGAAGTAEFGGKVTTPELEVGRIRANGYTENAHWITKTIGNVTIRYLGTD